MPSSRQEIEGSTPARTLAYRSGSSHRPNIRSHSGRRSLEMSPSHHRFTCRSEQLEVTPLARQQGVRIEMRDDSLDEKRKASHLPLQRLVAAIRSQRATTEVPLDLQQHLIAVAVLTDRETWSDLPADT